MSESLTLRSLPLFPLDKVLFPGGVLPMRIIDARYRDMVTRCHQIGAPFGLVTPVQVGENPTPAPSAAATPDPAQSTFNAIGTLVTITEFSNSQPDLVLLRCSATQRFRLTSIDKLRHGLWIATVSPLTNDSKTSIPEKFRGIATALHNLIDSLQARNMTAQQMPVQPPFLLDDCGWVANRWCELLPMPQEQKRRLLELHNPVLRLELVGEILKHSGIAI